MRNIAYHKDVRVSYSTNDGASWSQDPLSYSQYMMYGYGTVKNPNQAGFEAWTGAMHVGQAQKVIFRIEYRVNGQTHIDDNHGANYTVVRAAQ